MSLCFRGYNITVLTHFGRWNFSKSNSWKLPENPVNIMWLYFTYSIFPRRSHIFYPGDVLPVSQYTIAAATHLSYLVNIVKIIASFIFYWVGK